MKTISPKKEIYLQTIPRGVRSPLGAEGEVLQVEDTER